MPPRARFPVVVLTATQLDDFERRTLESHARRRRFQGHARGRSSQDNGLTQTLARLGLA